MLPSTTVRDQGILIDSDVTMRSHVSWDVLLCYDSSAASDVQCPTLVFHSLVVSLVMPRLDYGNATLAGLPVSQLRRLQSVLKAAARLTHLSLIHI